MFSSDSDNRTVAPTPRRLEEARSAGQVPRSIGFTSAIVAGGATLAMWMLGSKLWSAAARFVESSLTAANQAPGAARPLESIQAVLSMASHVALGTAGVLLAVMASAIAANVIQFGFRLTPTVISPDPRRISPAEGIRRVFSGGGVRVALFGARVVVLGGITWVCVAAIQSELARSSEISAVELPPFVGSAIGALLIKLSLGLLILASVDWLYRRWEYRRSLRLTPDEAREDARQSAHGRGFPSSRLSEERSASRIGSVRE